MTFWIKSIDGRVVKLQDRDWTAKIYASGEACDDTDYFSSKINGKTRLVYSIKEVLKRTDIYSKEKKRALEIELNEADGARKVAQILENLFANPSTLSLYNVDVLPEQQYFYEKDLFPLALLETQSGNGQVNWQLLDSVESLDYATPPLKALRLQIEISDRVPRFDSRLTGISLSSLTNAGEKITIKQNDESEMLSKTVDEIERFDPDIIVTQNGDSFVLPFLYEKASKYFIDLNGSLNRDDALNRVTSVSNNQQTTDKTYFSYGRVTYRPATQRLFGRLHLDEENTFIYDQCRLEGLFEVSRLCRIPLHTSMRTSIGKCLSSLQFYYATKQDVLIPWKPAIAEDFKSGYELLLADRGGLVLEPLPGIHEHICELDFASLYPSIIAKYNISTETVNCSCCDPQSGYSVEGLDLYICRERQGIVASSLRLPLSKRFEYERMIDSTNDKVLKRVYNERAAALKWILVCCLAKESPVLIQQNGQIQYVKIGNFIDSIVGEKEEGVIDCPVGVSVAGVGHDLKSKFCKVQKLLKIPNRQKLLNITMDDGRKIVATPNHPFYLLKNGNLGVSQASELKEGNFIPVAKRLASSQHNYEFIDVIDRLTKSLDHSELGHWRVSGPILSQAIFENKQAVLEESIKEGYSNQAVRVWIKTGKMPLRFFHLLNVPFELYSKLRVGIGRVKGKRGVTSWIPAVIPVNEELGFFLGLYVSDGSTTNTYIRFDIGYFERDLLENACRITESLFQTKPRVYKENGVNMYIVQINNLTLVKFVERILDIPNTSEKEKLKVPQIIFNSSKTVAQGFLEGMLAGDGGMNKARSLASIATASRDLANQIGYLAATLDLGFRIANHVRKFGNALYTINFAGPETLTAISHWKYLKKAHLAILEPKLEYLCNENGNLNCTHSSYRLFPTYESNIVLLAREARTVRTPRIDQRDSACPYRITKAIERIASKKLSEVSADSFANVKRMFQGDLGFVRIRKIEELDRTDEYVYCFQLDDNELPGFFTGEGAVFTHNCFGYLSYRNAKFGKIDSHVAVCAYARKTLLDAMHVAEYRGFRVVHGIVDSLWLSKDNRADLDDYRNLASEIQRETGFKLTIEGMYKWIVFLPSKINSSNQVANRYFGSFEGTNELKVRGIELRRHDTPLYFKKCQEEILKELAKCDNGKELRECARWKCVEIFEKYARRLEEHRVPPIELIIRRRLSKNPDEYSSARQLQVNAATHLSRHGMMLKAGQSVSYVITRYKSPGKDRSIPEEFVSSDSEYDSQRYVELLADCCATVLFPFGVTKKELLTRSRTLLSW